MARRERFGEFLVRRNVIQPEQLQAALTYQARHGSLLGECLVALGYLTRESLLEQLAQFYGVPFVSLRFGPPDPDAARLVSARVAHRYRLIPVARHGDQLTVAMANPADIAAEDEVRALTGLEVKPVLADADEIDEAIGRIFDVMANAERAIQNHSNGGDEMEGAEAETNLQVEDGPIVGLVQSLLVQAVRSQASDIHLEPQHADLRVRYRIDGVLHEVMRQPRSLLPAIITRLKVMAGMDIAERRLPQDGRFSLTVDSRTFDFRVSTVPSLFGEKAVLRILDKTGGVRSLASLGFTESDRRQIEALLARPYGLFLVVGPTGSGKSTTLAAAISHLNNEAVNIVTVEDPIEYQIPGICQMQINPRAGLTFANALRSILRQDPDVIMVGEIRDRETAEIAIQAALTGHVVLSTLHTNDAPGTVARLLDMGIEPVLLASALTGVLSQRLVRLLCPHCKEPYVLPDGIELPAGMRVNGQQRVFRAPSRTRADACRHCRGGYSGRTVLAELMVVENPIRDLILRRASSGEIRQAARAAGMRLMREDGWRRVLEGETSLEELIRVTESHSESMRPLTPVEKRVAMGG